MNELLSQIFIGFVLAFVLGFCASRLLESVKVVFIFLKQGKKIF